MDHLFRSATISIGMFALMLIGWLPTSTAASHLFELSLEELGNVVITGSTLTEKHIRDVPSAASVLTRDDIRKLPVSTVEELVNYIPGFQSMRSSDFADLAVMSIRGRRTGYTNREILVLLNGMRIDEYFSGGSTLVFANIPLANLARVEFIRGPGSAVYGSGAYTGVINLVTDDTANEAEIGISDSQRGHVNWQYASDPNDEAANRISAMLSAVQDEGQAYTVKNSYGDGQIDTQDSYQSYHGQLQAWLAQDTRLFLALAQNKADAFYIGGTVSDAFNHYDHTFAGLMLEQTLHWHPDIASNLQAGVQQMAIDSGFDPVATHYIGQISTPVSTQPLYLKTFVHTREWWLHWHNDWTLGTHDSLQFGLEYRNPSSQESYSTSNYDLSQLATGSPTINYYGSFSSSLPLTDKTQRHIFGLYVQQQHRWNDQLETIAGIRFDQYSQIGKATSPRLGIILHSSLTDDFKLLWGRAFRAPKADELYTDNNPLLRGNPDLKPETVDTYELIWLHHWQHSQTSINYFYNHFENPIRTALVETGRTYQNSQKAETSQGVELEWISELTSALSARLAATHLFETPDDFFRESSNWLAASATYTRSHGYGTLTLLYYGERENQLATTNQRETLDQYLEMNARIAWTPRLNVETWLELRNLLNHDSFVPANSGDIENGVPNRSREVRVGVRVSY